MTPHDFLSLLWPNAGHYCIATPFTPPGAVKPIYAHKVFTDIADACAYAAAEKDRRDIFFCVHTLAEPRVWNPKKTNFKTGEPGAYEVRTQANMLAGKAFFFDLDVEEGNNDKYASQRDAMIGLKAFCKSVGLPMPLITSSGGGLHVFWPLTEALPSAEWALHAAKLKQLARHYGLKADPARTTDTASVLRVAGTFNHKKGGKRPVELLTPAAKATDLRAFIKLLDDQIIRSGTTMPHVWKTAAPVIDMGLGSNLDEEFSGPPVSFRALVAACAQMQRLTPLRGNVSEPEWYHSINLVRFCDRGDKLVHLLSDGHPEYSFDATEAKIAQLKTKAVKPTSCLKLAEVAGEQHCSGCAFKGQVKSPIVAARKRDFAEPPVVMQTPGLGLVQLTVPAPPAPYARLRSGEVVVTRKNKEGDDITTTILDHDLYPVNRLVNALTETEQQMWRVVLPRHGDKDFTLDADALYDRRKFVACMANQGIYAHPANVEHLQGYMIAYIAKLQKEVDAEAQSAHLGWSDDQASFVLPDKILLPDGTAKPSSLSLQASRVAAQIKKKGTLQRQIELLKFYDHKSYVTSQFFILCGLASPLFRFTGHHGVVVNALGDPGASKSTSLYAAASVWGEPEMYTINGTNSGATARARAERVTVLANLPVCVDEITLMPHKEAQDLAMSITQPGHRLRLDRSGVERKGPEGEKSTIMLCTSNASLHGLLSTDNAGGTAGSMRVIELIFKKTGIHSKAEADEFMHQLKQNYGHLGEEFARWIVANPVKAEKLVREVMRRIDAAANIQPGERFWSGGCTMPVVGAIIARKLGLLTYDPEHLFDWVVNRLIPHMRGILRDSYTNPEGVLADYLETINDNILVVHKAAYGNLSNVSHTARGQLLARYEVDEGVMWLLRKGFKDYCHRIGANSLQLLEELNQPRTFPTGPQRIITNKNVRKVLGAGTEQAKAQSWCFAVNMKHPDVTGVVDLAVIENPALAGRIARVENSG